YSRTHSSKQHASAQVRAWNALEHALIAAADRMQLLRAALRLPLPHSQEQPQQPVAQQARQQGPAVPCCAAWQAAPAPCACCSAAGGVRFAACRGPCAWAADIEQEKLHDGPKTTPNIIDSINYNI